MGDYFSIFYGAQIYEKSLEIEKNFASRKLEYFEAKQQLRELQILNQSFKIEVIKWKGEV
jgi:hypothetical protein